jgi:peptide/nickel transport system permease protein
MIGYLLNRIGSLIIVVIGVLTIVFFSLHLAPGDPVEVMLGDRSSQSERENLRRTLGLDQPISTQYKTYIKNLLQGDLGNSLHRRKPVAEIIASRIGATVQLALLSMLIASIIALPLGIIAARYPFRLPDRVAMLFSVLGLSIPNFVLGPVLILIFSLWLKWLPTAGHQYDHSWVLPTIALGTAMAAMLARVFRASLIEVKEQIFITTARSKGLSQSRIWITHIIPNALLPLITVWGLQFGTLLGGALIVEIVFNWQGLGSLLIEGIEQRDYPIVQGCLLVISLSYVIINMLIDILYAIIDPRIQS